MSQNQYISMTIEDLLSHIREHFSGPKKVYVTLATWDDGDYFSELCNEDGGLESTQSDLLKNKPTGNCYDSLSELSQYLGELSKIGRFHSVNGNQILNFDIHLWIGSIYFVFNPVLQRGYIEKVGVLKRLLSPMIRPVWQKA